MDDLHIWNQFWGTRQKVRGGVNQVEPGVARERNKGWGWAGWREGGVPRGWILVYTGLINTVETRGQDCSLNHNFVAILFTIRVFKVCFVQLLYICLKT